MSADVQMYHSGDVFLHRAAPGVRADTSGHSLVNFHPFPCHGRCRSGGERGSLARPRLHVSMDCWEGTSATVCCRSVHSSTRVWACLRAQHHR